jgi:excinuclease UvrABC nuclease subunit
MRRRRWPRASGTHRPSLVRCRGERLRGTGRANTAQYRRFRVRMDTPEANDVGMMAEVPREEELFVPGWDEAVVLPAGAPSLQLVKRIRGEAHGSGRRGRESGAGGE